jgi:heterodisulfide reductase subunit C
VETIDVSQLDGDFKNEIASRPGATFFKRCFSCGTCTASCPVSEIDEGFNPRLIIRQALLGMKKELLSSERLWFCAQCYTCYARCPQDVRFTDVMAVLRDIAVEQGYAPARMKESTAKVDTLAQHLRHGLAEYLWRSANGEDAAAVAKRLTSELSQGLKEL